MIWTRRVSAAVAAGAVIALAVAAPAPAQPAQPLHSATTTTVAPSSADERDPGRIAYVTPTGDVVVAASDGSSPITVGSGAVANDRGLTPLAWRQPASDAITYVRNDGALVVAPIDGSAPTILATDAVVPPAADEQILSWDISGSFLIYLAEPVPGRIESRTVDLTTAVEGGAPEIRPIGNPDRRTVLAQAFSPLDPIIYQKTADIDTGRQFTVAIVEPFKGTIYGSDFTLDDVTFTPDGRYAFAVSKGTGDVQQLVRLDMRNPRGVDLVSDHDRVCNPSVSPNGQTIVFAAGERCQEVWTIKSNGTDPKMLSDQIGASATFDVGAFSWSQDNQTITHAACTLDGERSTCGGGGYWDISVDGRDITPRAVAGSALREFRPLLRPVDVEIKIDGPIAYTGKMQIGTKSTAAPFTPSANEVIEVKAVDENDNARSFEIKAVHPTDSVWVSGTVRVIDGEFDETFPFFGRILPLSLGYARLRGIWTRSERLPLQSGQIVITIER